MKILSWVETPGPFDTLETWESYRKELATIPEDDRKAKLISNADEVIADLKAGRRPDLSKTG